MCNNSDVAGVACTSTRLLTTYLYPDREAVILSAQVSRYRLGV